MREYLLQHSRLVHRVLNGVILGLSIGLIAYLSVDALRGREFIYDRGYMTYQLWVCIIFIFDFFVEMYMSNRRWDYFWRRMPFLLLSIPYINLAQWGGMTLTGETLYFARFIPLARGALAVSIVVGYLSANRLINIFASYTVILVAIVYLGSLIFYEREAGVNPDVTSYGKALWWACADATTTGSTIYPVTPVGRIVAAVLAIMGMVMFPLFTVVVTSAVRSRLRRTMPDAPAEPATAAISSPDKSSTTASATKSD